MHQPGVQEAGGHKAAIYGGLPRAGPLQERRRKADRKERARAHRTSFIGFRKPLCWGSGPGLPPRDDATPRHRGCARENYSQARQMAARPEEPGSRRAGAQPQPRPPSAQESSISRCRPSPPPPPWLQGEAGLYDIQNSSKGRFNVVEKSQFVPRSVRG